MVGGGSDQSVNNFMLFVFVLKASLINLQENSQYICDNCHKNNVLPN